MLVISRDLVLSEPESFPAGTPWIGWHNLVTINNIVASSQDSSFPATNLANPSTHLKWQATSAAAQSLTITPNQVEAVDYFAIAVHNFGSGSIPLVLEARRDSADAYTTLAEIVPADDAPLIFRFVPQSVYQIRLRMLAGAQAPRACVVYLGKLLVLERGIKVDVDYAPIPYARRAKIINGMSESGNFLGRIVLGEWREPSAAEFAHFRPAWYRQFFDPFVAASKTTPFFYAWDPIDHPKEVGYAWMINDPQPETNPVTRRVQTKLEMRAVA